MKPPDCAGEAGNLDSTTTHVDPGLRADRMGAAFFPPQCRSASGDDPPGPMPEPRPSAAILVPSPDGTWRPRGPQVRPPEDVQPDDLTQLVD